MASRAKHPTPKRRKETDEIQMKVKLMIYIRIADIASQPII